MKYDPQFFKRTEERLGELLGQLNPERMSEADRKAIAHLQNLEEFDVKFIREKPISN